MSISQEEAAALPLKNRIVALALHHGLEPAAATMDLCERGLRQLAEEVLLSGQPVPIYLYRSVLAIEAEMKPS